MNPSSKQSIRVLVVEDARSKPRLLSRLLQSCSDFVVVGVAGDGKMAITEAQRLHPQVIAMDIDLPVLDGYEATRQIMQLCPTPIVLISSQNKAPLSLVEALDSGALTVVYSPTGHAGILADAKEHDEISFLTTLRLMANVRVVTRHALRSTPNETRQPSTIQVGKTLGDQLVAAHPQLLAIAASTGGPAALQTVLQGLGSEFPLPILVVQHITPGFVATLVEWLNRTVPFQVKIAYQNEYIQPGHVYVAPQSHHLLVRTPGVIHLRAAAEQDRLCPSADLLFESIASAYGKYAIGLILTGMGDDGTRGLRRLHTAGSPTLAQDAESAIVYGMPGAAVEAGAISQIVPLASLAGTILRLVQG